MLRGRLHRRGLSVTLLALLQGALVLFWGAMVAGAATPAGTHIITSATLNFSQGANSYSATSNQTDVTVTSSSSAGVTLVSSQTGYVQAGKWDTYSHTVTNTGAGADTIDLSAVSSLGLTVEFFASDGTTPLTDTDSDGKVDTGPLAASATYSFVVKLSAPENLHSDDIDQTTITAASSADTAKTASVVDTSTILKSGFWDPLVKTADPPGQITPETVLTYTNTFGNAGNIPATNVVITDTLDANLIYIDGSATEPPGISGTIIVYDSLARTVTWTIPSILAGYEGQISFRARINPAISSDTGISNTISQVSDQTPVAQLSNVVSSTVVEQPLRITKTANKQVAEIGDYVGYTVTVENTSTTMTVSNVTITDTLPHGFRYLRGSTQLDGSDYNDPTKSTNPAWNIGSMSPGTTRTLTYRTLISIGSPLGNGVNSASVAGRSPGGNSVTAGPSTATVKVKEGVLNDKAIILGRVFVDVNHDKMPDEDEPGVKGARIYLEDGTYVITDEEGKFSIFGVEPGEHVLKLDRSSIPSGYKMETLDNTFAGDGGSRFVSVPFGGPARGDFALVETSQTGQITQTGQAGQVKEKKGRFTFGAEMKPAPAPLEKQIESMEATTEILEPANGVVLRKDWGEVAVRVTEGASYILLLNGRPQSAADNVGTIIHESERGIFIHKYVGLKFEPGVNRIKLEAVENGGRAVTKEIEVTAPGPPEKIVVAPDRTDIPADGITDVLVTVTLADHWGNRSPDEQVVTVKTAMGVISDPDLDSSMAGHQLKTKDGMVRFKLRSSGKTGKDQIIVNLGSALEQTADIWFVPALRDWIVAGVGEMKFGNRDISGNVSKITKRDDFDKGAYHDDRLAFFAKGKVLEKYQLTAAYDSQKDKKDELFQKTEPNQYYPIYGDSSTIGYEAESREKLYLKLERDRSYVMFGDYRTSLSGNEFSRYDRTFNGIKSEVESKYFSFRGFGSYTNQSVKKDELAGNGTSGFYFLTSIPIMENSEKVRVEVRDRYHPETVVSTKDLSRNTDYQINYTTGTILFKEPVPSLDEKLNPVKIVVVYESNDPGDRYYIYGGRAAVKLAGSEAGITGIVEEKALKDSTLLGADATIRLGQKARIKFEAAISDSLENGKDEAWKVEAEAEPLRNMRVTAYYRDVGVNFQNPSMSGAEGGTKKYGGKIDYRLTEKTQIVAERFTQENRVSEGKLTSNELSLIQKIYGFMVNAGYKHLNEEHWNNAGSDTTSSIIMTGVSGNITDRLGFLVSREQVLSSGQIRDYQTKTGLRLDYKLTEKSKAYVTQEFQQGKHDKRDATLFGLEHGISDNTTLSTRYQIENAVSGERSQASIGLNNKWEVTKGLLLNTRVERIQTVKKSSGDSTGSSDGTAVSLGAEYLPSKDSKVTARYEVRFGENERSSLYNVGAAMRINRYLSVLASANLWESRKPEGTDVSFDGLAGIALRTMGNRSVYLLSTLRHKLERSGSSANETSKSYISSTEASYRVNPKLTLLGKYAGKYSQDNMNSKGFSSYTDMILAGIRYDITERWDVEVSVRLMNQYLVKMYSTGAVIRTGFRVYKNLYADIGYNFSKLNDRDLSGESYAAHGFFVGIRFKFDEDTLGLSQNSPKL